MTDFQEQMLARLAKCLNGIESTTTLARKMRTSRVAVASAGYALERAGLVWSMRSDDSEQAALMWAIRSRTP